MVSPSKSKRARRLVFQIQTNTEEPSGGPLCGHQGLVVPCGEVRGAGVCVCVQRADYNGAQSSDTWTPTPRPQTVPRKDGDRERQQGQLQTKRTPPTPRGRLLCSLLHPRRAFHLECDLIYGCRHHSQRRRRRSGSAPPPPVHFPVVFFLTDVWRSRGVGPDHNNISLLLSPQNKPGPD